MGSERLPQAARRLLQRSSDAPITFEEAWAACPWRSILGCGRNADELLHQLGATVAIVGHDREPLSADVIADVLATLARGETVLLIAARRADRDFAKAQILGMAAAHGGRA